MSRGINKVILVGNAGQEPDIRYTPSGKAIAIISVATGREWKDRQTGKKQSATEWHRVTFFEPLSNIVSEHVKKGQQLYIEGFLRTRKWHDQNNNVDRYSTEVVATEMEMLGGKPRSGSDGTASSDPASAPTASDNSAPANPQPTSTAGGDFDGFDDDIPF